MVRSPDVKHKPPRTELSILYTYQLHHPFFSMSSLTIHSLLYPAVNPCLQGRWHYLQPSHAACTLLSFYHVFNLDNPGEKRALTCICLVEWPTWRRRGDLFFFFPMTYLGHYFWSIHVLFPKKIVSPPSHTVWEFPYFLTRTSVEWV